MDVQVNKKGAVRAPKAVEENRHCPEEWYKRSYSNLVSFFDNHAKHAGPDYRGSRWSQAYPSLHY